MRTRARHRPVYNLSSFRSAAALSDDTTRLQTALDVAAETGGVVFVPPGTYHIAAQIRLSDRSRLALWGAGPTSQLVFDGVDVGIGGGNVRHVTIARLSLSGRAGRLLAFSGSAYLTIRENAISGASLVPQDGGYPAGIDLQDVDYVRILSNDLSGNGLNSEGGDIVVNDLGQAASHLLIRGNRCQSNMAGYGIALFNTTFSRVEANQVGHMVLKAGSNNSGYGIVLYGKAGGACGHNRVIGNVVQDTQGTGIYVQSSHATRVIGNTVIQAAQTQDDTALLVGGIASNAYAVRIENNTVQRSGKVGIVVEGAQSVVQQNTVQDTQMAGIALRGGRHNSTIAGNRIAYSLGGIADHGEPISGVSIVENTICDTRCSPAGTPSDGIRLTAPSNCTVARNTIRHCSGSPVVVPADPGNTVADNAFQPEPCLDPLPADVNCAGH